MPKQVDGSVRVDLRRRSFRALPLDGRNAFQHARRELVPGLVGFWVLLVELLKPVSSSHTADKWAHRPTQASNPKEERLAAVTGLGKPSALICR